MSYRKKCFGCLVRQPCAEALCGLVRGLVRAALCPCAMPCAMTLCNALAHHRNCHDRPRKCDGVVPTDLPSVSYLAAAWSTATPLRIFSLRPTFRRPCAIHQYYRIFFDMRRSPTILQEITRYYRISWICNNFCDVAQHAIHGGFVFQTPYPSWPCIRTNLRRP